MGRTGGLGDWGLEDTGSREWQAGRQAGRRVRAGSVEEGGRGEGEGRARGWTAAETAEGREGRLGQAEEEVSGQDLFWLILLWFACLAWAGLGWADLRMWRAVEGQAGQAGAF